MKNWGFKLAAFAVSSIISIASAVGYVEYKIRTSDTSIFGHNPVIAKQVDDHNFFPDPSLGHRLTPAFADIFNDDYDKEKVEVARKEEIVLPSSFIGVYADEIQTIDEVVASLDLDKPVVLNLGDSSTSGWDSDVVTRNNKARRLAKIQRHEPEYENPFFQYETYSDLLAEQGFSVINTGTPGYTTYQGKLYIERLLNEFEERNVEVDYVTIYFGNNDSVWNGNFEESYFFSEGIEKRLGFLRASLTNRFSVIPKVSVEDYKQNLRKIIETVMEHNTEPILIRPVIPSYWHPGLRAEGREAEVWKLMYEHNDQRAFRDLERAISVYEDASLLYDASTEANREQAQDLFAQAQELDYIVPRIKPEYVEALQEVAVEMGISLVDVQDDIPVDDRDYFVDYCHPIEPANLLIAEGIGEVIASF